MSGAIDADRVNRSALATWMTTVLGEEVGGVELRVLKGGQSNPTFLVSTESGRWVLRGRPAGAQRWMHAIDREYRVLRALGPTPVKVPQVYGYCEDESIVGGPFYLMEFVDGRIIDDNRLPGLTPDERDGFFRSFARAIAEVHRVDPDEVGLADYGRPAGFVARQLELHSRVFRQDCPPGLEDLVWVADRLAEQDPGHTTPVLCHNDVRIGNTVFDRESTDVVSILDWELSTLGNQYADAALLAMVHHLPPNPQGSLQPGDAERLGIPSEREILAEYCTAAGLDAVPNQRFYLAFNLFRYAAVNHGVGVRAATGTAVSPDAAAFGASARPLAAAARRLIEDGLD